jgi:hypothetical protein
MIGDMTAPRHDVAFLHTAQAHVETFAQLVAESAPAVRATHVVAPDLLEHARSQGIAPPVVERVHARMREAAASGARVVVCTCSTVGAAAESCRGDFEPMRIDRPMADRAVRCGPRIGVVAALRDTIAPTVELLRSAASAHGIALPAVRIVPLLIEHAWPYFEHGDLDRYVDVVADAVRAAARDHDVIVLAQASMAPAVEHCGGIGTPVLSSPRLGVAAALERLQALGPR